MIGLLNETYLNRLRLLGERDRFYKPGDWTLTNLARNGLVVGTGRQDHFGRHEWAITEDGRKAVASSAREYKNSKVADNMIDNENGSRLRSG